MARLSAALRSLGAGLGVSLGVGLGALVTGCSDDDSRATTEGSAGSGGDAATSTSAATTSVSVGSGGAGGALPTDGLEVLTWNLEQFPKSVDTMALVVSVLEDARPDVVALQEIDEDGTSFSLLDEALVDYEGIAAEEGDGFRRVAMLYRPDRVTVEDVATLFRSEYAFPRPMLGATFALEGDPARAVVVGVVHLKANVDDESAQRRRDACVILDDWILARQGAGVASPFVILGDFNDELTDPEVWNVFGPLLAPDDGGFLTLPLEQAGDVTFLPFDSFLDHVHVRGGGAFAGSSAEVLHLEDEISSYVSKVSDHRPVRATIALP